MKNICISLVVLAMLISLSGETAFALRCKGRIIDRGSNKAKVLDHCGEPTWIEERQEERIIYDCYRRYRKKYKDYEDRYRDFYYGDYRGRHKDCIIYVTIDEWFYNFGPGRFTQTLIFENNRLVHIEEGEYGY